MRRATGRRRELPAEVLVEGYLRALLTVVESGFGYEIDWQEQCRLDRITESVFLQEAAWVILSAGMREQVVRQRFPRVAEAFLNWSSAEDILRVKDQCSRSALAAFNHPAKISAITWVAEMVARRSFCAVRAALETGGVEMLGRLPYIGPVTKFHLAKNLGLDVAKPDRHLMRLSESAGCSSPQRLCQLIATVTGDRVPTVDIVLWRYATIVPAYWGLFQRRRPSR